MEVKLFDSLEEANHLLAENKPTLVRANGKNICIVNRGKELLAFDNECPHQGESLHKGRINYLGEIVCPLHSYRFSLMNGETSSPCKSLRFIPIIIRDAVYLELNPIPNGKT